MPRACLFMIRTALFWLLSGYTVGGLLMLNKVLSFLEPIWSLRAGHIYMLAVGWMVQLSAGMMIWIMPRLLSTGDRGDMRPVWFMYVTLNAGVVLATLHPLLSRLAQDAPLNLMMPLAGGLMLAATLAFIVHIWPRLRPVVEPLPSGRYERQESKP